MEIAEWDSAEDQAAAVAQAMASGFYTPVIELVAAPFRVTRITQLNVPERSGGITLEVLVCGHSRSQWEAATNSSARRWGCSRKGP